MDVYTAEDVGEELDEVQDNTYEEAVNEAVAHMKMVLTSQISATLEIVYDVKNRFLVMYSLIYPEI